MTSDVTVIAYHGPAGERPVNQYHPDNPLNPANQYNSDVPFGRWVEVGDEGEEFRESATGR